MLSTSDFWFWLIMPGYLSPASKWIKICLCRYSILPVCLLCQSDRFFMNLLDLPTIFCCRGCGWACFYRNFRFGLSGLSDFLNFVRLVCGMRLFCFLDQYRSISWDQLSPGTQKCTDFIRWIARLCSTWVWGRPRPSRPAQRDSTDRRYARCRSAGRRCKLRRFCPCAGISAGRPWRIS